MKEQRMATRKSPKQPSYTKKPSTTSKNPVSKTPKETDEIVDKPKAATPSLNRGDLLEKVKSGASGVNGQVVSAVMDIVLLELAQAIQDGKTIKALPIGNLVIQKRRPREDGEVLICKLRIKDPKPQNLQDATTDKPSETR
jgi:nucleoid DNA-binding protein